MERIRKRFREAVDRIGLLIRLLLPEKASGYAGDTEYLLVPWDVGRHAEVCLLTSRMVNGEMRRELLTSDSVSKRQFPGRDVCDVYPDGSFYAMCEGVKKGLEGAADVRFLLHSNGKIERVEIIKSSQIPLLDEAAVRAVREGNPFPPFPESISQDSMVIEVTLNFELHGRY